MRVWKSLGAFYDLMRMLRRGKGKNKYPPISVSYQVRDTESLWLEVCVRHIQNDSLKAKSNSYNPTLLFISSDSQKVFALRQGWP